MKFKVDENVPVDVADVLRGAGHDAMTVIDQRMSGASDRHVASICAAEGRILVTMDLWISPTFANTRLLPRPASLFCARPLRPDRTS